MSSGQSVVWISENAALPNVCIHCGMFADQHVKAKFVGVAHKTVEVKEGPSTGRQLMGCLLVFLGPIGLIISAVMALASQSSKNEDRPQFTTQQVTTKRTVKVPQCGLCQTDKKVVPIDGNVDEGQYAFEAHRNFIQKYHELQNR